MPNSINRRRVSGPSDSSSEIAALQAELENLRKLYIEDMTNVSNDMRTLSQQVSAAGPVAVSPEPTGDVAPTVDEPAPPNNQVI